MKLGMIVSTAFALLAVSHVARAEWLLEVGLALHPESLGRPEIQMNNPLGVVEVSYRLNEKLRVLFNHTSSIVDYEQGYGMNTVELRYKLR